MAAGTSERVNTATALVIGVIGFVSLASSESAGLSGLHFCPTSQLHHHFRNLLLTTSASTNLDQLVNLSSMLSFGDSLKSLLALVEGLEVQFAHLI
jgi:hypothetical protein